MDNTLRKASEMALEALEWSWGGEPLGTKEFEAITALRTALAQPEQEPVAWRWENNGSDNWIRKYTYLDNGAPDEPELCEALYTAPPSKSEQEPVAYLYHDTACAELANPLADSTLLVLACDRKPNGRNETPLYTAPPSKPWVSLTGDEIDDIAAEAGFGYINVARAIEAKLKELNHV